MTEKIDRKESSGLLNSIFGALKKRERMPAIALFNSSELRRRSEEAKLNIQDINRKIEKLNQITEKWREKGRQIDIKN